MSWGAFAHTWMFDRRHLCRRGSVGLSVLPSSHDHADCCIPIDHRSRVQAIHAHKHRHGGLFLHTISLSCLISNTHSFSRYEFHQYKIEALSDCTASVQNKPLIDAVISFIILCVIVATLFGRDIFLYFFPTRTYPRCQYDTTRKDFALVVCAIMAVGALMFDEYGMLFPVVR